MRVARQFLILVAAMVASWAGQEIKEGPGEILVADEIVIRLKPGATMTGVLRSLNITANTVASGTSLPVQVIRVPAGLRQTLSTILANHPDIEYVEPHRIRAATELTPNDTSFALQWWLSKLQAGAAWSLLPGELAPPTPSARRVRVAVLDTGADCTHPDFSNSAGGSTDSAAGGQFSFALSQAIVPTTITGTACAWQDDHGHGTHVAGILAAATNNGAGVSGLGFPAELMIFKVLGKTGFGTDIGIANAITMAANGGARVISLSLGGNGYSQLLQDAVNYAWERNSLVIAAAGNAGSNSLFFPAAAQFVLGVGATDSVDARASFSNYGFGLDVMAPGVSILSAYPGGVYRSMSGTSMATPLVSAVAALIAASTSTLAADALAQRIEMASDSTVALGGWDQYYGYGRVNAVRSLNGTLRPAKSGGLTGQVLNASGEPVEGAQLSLGGVLLSTNSTGLFRFTNMDPGADTLTVTNGANGRWSHTVVIPPGADGAVRISLGVPTGAFTGSVTSGGTPLAGAVVQALDAGFVHASAVTDGNGQYTLPVTAGRYDLRSSAVGHAAYSERGQKVAAGGSAFVPMPMLPLGAIKGTVLDGAGAPLAGAQIIASSAAFSAGAVTDVKGGFTTLGLPEGTYSVSAAAADFPAGNRPGVAVIDGGTTVANFQLGSSSALAMVALARSSVSGGATLTGNTVTLSGPAGSSGAIVTLVSSNPAAIAPASVAVPPGATQSAPFNIATSAVAVSTPITVSATLSGATKSASFTIVPASISAVSISPAQLKGGSAGTSNRVSLGTAAPSAGAVIQLTSSLPDVAAVPASVTVPAGATDSPFFTITATAVKVATQVTVTATYSGSTKTAALTVAPAALTDFSVSPSSIPGGKAITSASVTLDGPAPAEGAVVLLTSSDISVLPPASVTVPAGSRTAGPFTIPTAAVSVAVTVTISASLGDVTRSATVTVRPPSLNKLSASTTPILGGKSLGGVTVALDVPAPATGTVVILTSANPAVATPPATVTVAAGETVSPPFAVATSAVRAETPVVITASYGGASQSVTVVVRPAVLHSLSLATTPILGGTPINGATILLDGPAPPGGAIVTLSSNNPAAAAPPDTITIPEGAAASPPFSISTSPVSTTTPVILTAAYLGISHSAAVTVRPASLLTFTISPAALNSKKPVVGATVTLDGPAPEGGAVVKLSSDTPNAANPPATVTVPAGATASKLFLISTSAVSTATSVVLTATYGGESQAVTLNLKPPSLSLLSLRAASVAGGEVIEGGAVTLDGPAPPGGAVITLTSDNPSAATPPGTVRIPTGARSSPEFAISTGEVAEPVQVTVTASYGESSRTVVITVTPAAAPPAINP